MDRAEYICSYAVDLYSTAEVEEKLNNINLGPLKSRKAIEAVFKKFNIPVEESKNISLKIVQTLCYIYYTNVLTIMKNEQYNKYRRKMFSLYGGASNKLSISLNVLALWWCE